MFILFFFQTSLMYLTDSYLIYIFYILHTRLTSLDMKNTLVPFFFDITSYPTHGKKKIAVVRKCINNSFFNKQNNSVPLTIFTRKIKLLQTIS